MPSDAGLGAPIVVAPPDQAQGAVEAQVASPPALDVAPIDMGTSAGAIDVTVRARSKGDRLLESAEAVKVVELVQAKTQSADLGDVLARTPGVSVRRTGGLGSGIRFSLNGLQDEQIRFFLDGIPLDLMGYTSGLANVPVNLLSRVEIYAGIVPIRFGADALGGAVNLVSDEKLRGTRAGASYQLGSFGTHRATFAAQHVHARTGFFARLDGFLDKARNDYEVRAELINDQGVVTPITAKRFHDGYQALGGGAEVGFVRKRWAKRLSLRGFISDFDKELQHDFRMQRPYGEATDDRRSTGGVLRYENDFGPFTITSAAGYALNETRIRDVSTCVYNWRGVCGSQSAAGEIENYTGGKGSDAVLERHNAYARVNLGYNLAEGHIVRVSLAPTYFRQTGEDLRLRGTELRDPLTAKRTTLSFVSGLEYQLSLFDDRVQSISFVKHYFQRGEIEAGGGQQRWEVGDESSFSNNRVGGGTELRVRLTDYLLTKAAYEYALRLPRSDELLGDPPFIDPNLKLGPESGHNANLGALFDLRDTKAGSFRAGATGFVRYVEDLIVLLENSPTVLVYHNVLSARARGIESNVGWTSPGAYFSIDGNLTRQSFISTSDASSQFKGKALPNRPSFFANVEARLSFKQVFFARDEIALIGRTNWIGWFYRGWGGAGIAHLKDRVPEQLQHSLALTYLFNPGRTAWSATVEGQNLTDATVYDYFGIQKPGRAFYGKITAHLE